MTMNIFRLLYEPKFMIEMDRFVFYMRGVEFETIERKKLQKVENTKYQRNALVRPLLRSKNLKLKGGLTKNFISFTNPLGKHFKISEI